MDAPVRAARLRLRWWGAATIALLAASLGAHATPARADGSFAPPVEYTLPSFPTAIVAGDFNQDRNADLAVPVGVDSGIGGELTVASGRGDGTLRKPRAFPANTYPADGWSGPPVAIAAGDLNGDRDTDLAVANLADADNTGGGDATVLSGRRGSVFSLARTLAVARGARPADVVIADLDGDFDRDLAVLNHKAGTVSIFKNRGDGTFKHRHDFPVPGSGDDGPVAMVVGDFNGDGSRDLATASRAGVATLINRGRGHFKAPVSCPTSSPASDLVRGDFNGDGRADLAIVDGNDVSMLLDGCHPRSPAPVDYPAGADVDEIAKADFNGDGARDVVVTKASGLPVGSVAVLHGDGKGGLGPPTSFDVTKEEASFLHLAARDLNGDGRPDLAVVGEDESGPGGPGILSVLLNAG